MNGRRTTALILGLADCLTLVAMFNLIAVWRGVTTWEDPLLMPLFLPSLFFVAALYVIEGYDVQTDFISLDYTSVHIIAVVVAMLGVLLVTFAFVPVGYSLKESRAVIVFGFAAAVPLSIAYRRMWHLRVAAARRQRTIVFAGDTASCAEFAAECQQMKTGQPLVLCATAERSVADPTEMISLREALAWIEAGTIEPEAIVLREAAPQLPPDLSDELLRLYFNGIPIYTLEFFHETYWGKIPRYRLNQIWLFQEGFQITREPVFEHAKRLSDVLLAVVGLVAFAPLLIVAAVAIWLEDRGPVFFTQMRVGRNRRPFRMFKLRTMRPDRNADHTDPYTQKGDDRVTRVGRILRTTRLDEVPQLWNVLHGQMSLIGPRAEWDRLVARYEETIPCYHFRHLVKPGITGWAQVNYPYGSSTDDTMRKLEYDLYYIRHFSFLLDATIVLKTVHIMLFGKGQ